LLDLEKKVFSAKLSFVTRKV